MLLEMQLILQNTTLDRRIKTPSCEIVTSLAYTRDPLRVRPQDASCETSRGSQTQTLRAFDLSVRSAELRKFSIVQDTLCTTYS